MGFIEEGKMVSVSRMPRVEENYFERTLLNPGNTVSLAFRFIEAPASKCSF